MLSVLVKQGTTLHLSPGGGVGRDRSNFGGWDHIIFGGGGGGGGNYYYRALREDRVNYGPITRVIGS